MAQHWCQVCPIVLGYDQPTRVVTSEWWDAEAVDWKGQKRSGIYLVYFSCPENLKF